MRIRHHEYSEFLNLVEPAELPVARATKMLLFIISSSLTRSTVGLTKSNCRCAHLAVLMHTRRLRDESLMTGAALWSSFWQALFKSPPADEGNAGDTATGRNSAPTSRSTQQVVQQRTASTGKLLRQRDASCSSCLLKGAWKQCLDALDGLEGCDIHAKSQVRILGRSPAICTMAICTMPSLRPHSVVLERP